MLAADAACPGCGRSACRSAANGASVPSSASTDIAAVMSAVLSSARRSAAASTSMPSMPSVPLISASPSFSASTTGSIPAAARASPAGMRMPAGRPAFAARPGPRQDPDLAFAHRGQGAVRERRQVAGAAERTVLADHRRDPGVEHLHVGPRGRQPDAGPAGGEGGQAQQHHRADHLGLRPPDRTRPRASGPATAAAGRAARAGCAWWPARRSRSKRRSAVRCRPRGSRSPCGWRRSRLRPPPPAPRRRRPLPPRRRRRSSAGPCPR